MKTLLAVVGVLVLAVSSTPAPAALSDQAAWREACRVSRYSCAWLSPPLVAQAPLGTLLGRYRMGDKYILVNERISGPLAYAVKVHEMTHYLQWKHKKWKFTHESKCENEKEAFDVSNAVLRRLGETRDIVDWDVLKAAYGCP